MFELGSSLRAARERQGLSYAEVEHATKIRAKYIRALEAEEFGVLPSDAYIRGFLRSYAEYLGLDGDVYVDEYGSRFITSWRDDVPPPPRARRRRPRERSVDRRAVLLAIGGIVVLFALVFVAWQYGGASSTPPPGLTTGTQPQRTATVPGLTLRGTGKGTYLVVRRGSKKGGILFQGTLGAGSVQRFTGRRFYVFARKPRGVRIVTRGSGVTVVGSA